MKRVGRRGFAKSMGIAAALAPMLLSADAEAVSAPQAAGADAAADKVAGTALTAEQQNKLGDAIARRDVQLAQLHAQPLPYDLEPAFVFRARAASRSVRKP